MYSFRNDYSEGAHPRILAALERTNLEQTPGYGEDPHTENARRYLRQAVGEDCAVWFLMGGTQVNLTVIAHALRPYQAVIAAGTGHISVHETGAVEATGHKVIEVGVPDGKLTARAVERAARAHTDHHMVQPRLVYLSQPTELGTLYTLAELRELRRVCDENSLLLYADGARLFSALAARGNDVFLPELYRLTDAFTVGGTKGGALFGEALVMRSPLISEDFLWSVKQRGGLLAKGRLLGVQFEELFRDGLYVQLGESANHTADMLRQGLSELGYPLAFESRTNQTFTVFPDQLLPKLEKEYGFEVWGRSEPGFSVVRLVTSWAAREADVEGFLRYLRSC